VSREKGKGSWTSGMRPHLRLCPQREARTRCFEPLDAECGRVKLRGVRRGQSPQESYKALPRAGFEAPEQSHGSGRPSWISGNYRRPGRCNGRSCLHTHGLEVALEVSAPYYVNRFLRDRHVRQRLGPDRVHRIIR
jgi:hypothetical protein